MVTEKVRPNKNKCVLGELGKKSESPRNLKCGGYFLLVRLRKTHV